MTEQTQDKKDVLTMEINSDPLDNRAILQAMIRELRGPDGKPASREIALAIAKLQEAGFWLFEAQFPST